jgi:hypothetical protein
MPQSDTRSLQQIKEETEQTRADLAATVAQLRSSIVETSQDFRERMRPAALKAEVRTYVRSRGEQLFDDLTDAIRKNPLQAVAVLGSIAYPLFRLARAIPIPVYMIGAGLYLAKSETGKAATQKVSDAAADMIDQAAQRATAFRDRVSDAAAAVGDTAGGLKETIVAGANSAASGSEQLRRAAGSAGASLREASEDLREASEEKKNRISQMAAAAVEKAVGLSENVAAAGQRAGDIVKNSASEATETAQQAALSAKQAAADLSERASRTFVETVEQNALLVAGLGLVIGGVIAGALPRTDLEDEFMGETSRSARRRAKATASRAVREGARRAARQAETEGLDPEGLGEAVRDVGERVRHVAETAVTTAFEPPEENEQSDVHNNQTSRE